MCISNVGPTAVILVMSTLVAHPVVKGLGIQTLQVPAKFALQGSRPWLVDLRAVSPALRMFAALPALLLTMLFYLDQNISVRAANQTTGLSKGPAYHLDMLVLAVCVGGLSLVVSRLYSEWVGSTRCDSKSSVICRGCRGLVRLQYRR
jgi:hypothetical protein